MMKIGVPPQHLEVPPQHLEVLAELVQCSSPLRVPTV